MASGVQKIKLSPSRDIPFNKLVLSQSNVRRVKAGVSIEQLAESIAQRTLLQSLSVRAVVDAVKDFKSDEQQRIFRWVAEKLGLPQPVHRAFRSNGSRPALNTPPGLCRCWPGSG